MPKKQLPIGTEDFKELRQHNFYYIDKTALIKELFDNYSEVSLFTRPRRFGKSLTMSMLRHFFEIGTDKTLFDNLTISKEKALCEAHMGQYPVIFISLKSVEGRDYLSAREAMWDVIRAETSRLCFLSESKQLDSIDKATFLGLRTGTGNLESSLKVLTQLLYKHYEKKSVVLIDEYDVPLDKAHHHGYYNDMILLIRLMFGSVLKTNEYLRFAILTGCLRVSKESIFTGLNNIRIHSITDTRYDNCFGFTDQEVYELLNYYELNNYYELTKQWYDGYHFGQTNLYCPWDVINWCADLRENKNATPKAYWANTSSNTLIREFAQNSDLDTRQQIGELIDGKSFYKKIHLDMTYTEIHDNIDNLWSLFFMTGYLTARNKNDYGEYALTIPNQEIRSIFIETIEDWFKEKVKQDTDGLEPLITAFHNADAEEIKHCLNDILDESVSYLDGGQTIKHKESFYHGLLLGILQSNSAWEKKSNREGGKGRPDIAVRPRSRRTNNFGFIIEVKVAKENESLTLKAQEALAQIDTNEYDKYFERSEHSAIVHYGIAFRGKDCCVLKR